MTHTPPLPKLPEPDGFRTRYQSEPRMIGHYPWTYADQSRRRIDRPNCESEYLFTADKLRAYALEALSQRGEAVGEVVWYDPALHPLEDHKRAQKIIDASFAFMDSAPIGTKLFTAPQPAQPDVLSLLLSDEVLEAATLAHEQSSCHDLIGPMSDALKAAAERVRAMVPARPAKPVLMTPEQVRDGIADWIDTNIPRKEFWTPEVVKLIRSIEINPSAFHRIKEQP